MIDHVSIAVSDLRRSAEFYRRVFAPLGMAALVEEPHRFGFGKRYPEFWINERPAMRPVDADTGCHVCLRARDREAVRLFFEIALDAGGLDDGPPGNRTASMTDYYAAFVRDPDGNRLEAATFPR
ncbi:MAG: VOC family protein [Pseudomonadota bacterium]